MLKGNAGGTNGSPGKGRPSVPPRSLHCRGGHISKCAPSSERPGCQLSGNRDPLHPPQGAGSQNAAVAPVWYRQSLSTNTPPPPLREGVGGSRSRPGLERGLPKPASLTSAGPLPPSQSLSTLMCTIKWLCLRSQKLTRLGSLREGSSTLPGEQTSKIFYLISS